RPFFYSRFSRDVLWNTASLVILGVSGIIINLVIMALRGPRALGIFNQVFAFYIVISQIAAGGIQFSALKHCSYKQDNMPECAVITSSALMLVAFLGIIICITLFSLRDVIGRILGSPSVSLGLSFAAPGLAFFSLNKVLLMALNGLRNMRAFAVFQALRYILILIIAVAIILLGYPESYLPLSLTLTEVILFLALMLYINLFIFHMRFSVSSEMLIWFRRHISFGSRGFLSGVLIEMNTRVDVLMLGYFMSDKIVGIYSFASTFAEGFAQLNTVVRQNVDPIVGKCFSEGDIKKIHEIAYKIRQTFYPIMAMLGAALIIGFPILIWIITPKGETWQSWGIFAILVFGIVLSSGYRPFITLTLQGGRPGNFTIMIAITVLGNMLLNYYLIPILGVYGAAVATAFIYIFDAGLIVFFSWKLFGIRLYGKSKSNT
ncbi:MAG: oligosaccharide flippase family protein, partial [Thermodesulfobacteriota bacterium]|nr:oligosaccharide flippase family protein [Thermodesulfobacteriota bacterium]